MVERKRLRRRERSTMVQPSWSGLETGLGFGEYTVGVADMDTQIPFRSDVVLCRGKGTCIR